MLASHSRRPLASPLSPSTRAVESAARRQAQRRASFGLGARRWLLHGFCLLLVGLSVTGPLARLSDVGDRAEVAREVQAVTRLLQARQVAGATAGWIVPAIPVTNDELNEIAPLALNIPAVMVEPMPAAETAPVAAAAGAGQAPAAAQIPAAPAATAPTSATAAAAPEAARAALLSHYGSLSDSYGIVVADASGNTLFEHRPANQFQAASLYKLGVMAEAYRQRKAGAITFKDLLTVTRESLVEGDTVFTAADVGKRIPIGDAVSAMITRSSNVAALLLLRRLGPANVNTLFVELGMPDTKLLDRPFRNVEGNARNQTSPRDMARFFSLLLRGRVIDAQTSQTILKLLLDQMIDDRLPAALPKGVPIAHKTGNLVGVVHDAGIIFSPAGPLIVVGLSHEVASEEEAAATIAQVARVAYEAYTGVAVAHAERPLERATQGR